MIGGLEFIRRVIGDYPLAFIELSAVAVAICVAFRAPHLGQGWFKKAEFYFSKLARKPVLAVVSIGLLAVVARVVLLPVLPIPAPGPHDEFSYLLAADTFAHWRLTNLTHPMWVHFESFHIIHQPTYQSMYPIAQSLVLAVGQLISGEPWVGVLLSVGLMCAMLVWMLQAWVPPGWALLGGVIVVARIGVFSYWMNGYMGGAVAAIGGALVLGAVPRLMQHRRVRDALLLGVGVAILANSRPLEGVALSLPVAVGLAWWFLRLNSAGRRQVFRRVVMPTTLVLLAAGSATGYYFWRVTGDPMEMPYKVNRHTYSMAPVMLWDAPRPEPVYRHRVMEEFYQWDHDVVLAAHSLKGFAVRSLGKVLTAWVFYVGPVLTLALLALPWALRDKRLRFLVIVGGASLLPMMPVAYFNAHYAAPMVGILYALMLQSLRHLRAWRWRGQASGIFLVRAVPVICLLMMPIRLAAEPLDLKLFSSWRLASYNARPGNTERADIQHRLAEEPGRDVVVVRYAPDHDFHGEWVYNEASIDSAEVIWARDMGATENRELRAYFSDRNFWLLEADERPPRLTAFPTEGG